MEGKKASSSPEVIKRIFKRLALSPFMDLGQSHAISVLQSLALCECVFDKPLSARTFYTSLIKQFSRWDSYSSATISKIAKKGMEA